MTCLGLCLFIPRTHLGECGHSPVRAIFVSNQLPREGLPVLLALTMLTAAEVQLGGHLYWSPVCRPAATLFVAVCQHLTIPAMPEAYNSTVSSGGLRTIQATQYTRPHNSSLRPNVFVIIHESLGRKFMFDRSPIPGAQNNTLTRAEAAMPFFHERFRRDPHVYDFAFARTVSGNTENAMPALMSGRLIIGPQQSLSSRDDGLRDIPHLGAMARAAGYSPVIYCSYPSRYTSRWQRLNQFLHDAFDHVYDVDMLHAPRINEQGMDDRNLTSLLEDHFRRGYYDDGAGGEGRPPFFIVMVYNNQHVPFLVPSKEEIIQSHGSRVMPPNLTAGVARSKEAQEAESRLAWLLAAVEDHSNQARYMLSLSITDEMLRQVYELFHARQLLNSTIITLNSDHGEGPQDQMGQQWLRMVAPGTEIMSVPFYLRVPHAVLQRVATNKSTSISALQRHLRVNEDMAVSNLDLYPTLAHLILGHEETGSKRPSYKRVEVSDRLYGNRRYGILTGQSLLFGIHQNRSVYGYSGPPYSSHFRFAATMSRLCNDLFFVKSSKALHSCLDIAAPGSIPADTKELPLDALLKGTFEERAVVASAAIALAHVPALWAICKSYFEFTRSLGAVDDRLRITQVEHDGASGSVGGVLTQTKHDTEHSTIHKESAKQHNHTNKRSPTHNSQHNTKSNREQMRLQRTQNAQRKLWRQRGTQMGRRRPHRGDRAVV